MAFEESRDYLKVYEKMEKNKKLLSDLDRKIQNLQAQRAALAKKLQGQQGYLDKCGTGKKVVKAIQMAEKLHSLKTNLRTVNRTQNRQR